MLKYLMTKGFNLHSDPKPLGNPEVTAVVTVNKNHILPWVYEVYYSKIF